MLANDWRPPNCVLCDDWLSMACCRPALRFPRRVEVVRDLHQTWQSVFKKARSQDDQAKELLLGRLTLKAASDPNFQRELRSDPDEVVRREAKELDIKPTKGLIEAAGKVASAAIPGFEEAKVQALVFTTIEDMRTSFKLTLDLSRWLFIAELVLVSVSFVAGAFRASNWSVAVSGGAGRSACYSPR